MFTSRFAALPALLIATLLSVAACGGKTPPVPNAPPPAPAPFPEPSAPSTSPTRPPDPPPVPSEASIRSTPLNPYESKPIFFALDSDEIDDAARKVLAANAEVLRSYPTWVITVEGHCDERGSAEYNLALGDRRALAARNYLISLGISTDRLRTVSYGKEFPFDTGHTEASWSKNRRAHFLLTSK
jgi:peptidoglycan-associated lipoprotein